MRPLAPVSRPRPPVTRSGRAATVLHVLLALAGWAGFGVFWYRVFFRAPPDESAAGVLAVSILLVVSVSLTLAWVRHNLILSRRHAGRRRRTREPEPDWSHDLLGRPVAGPGWDRLQAAPEIEIGLDAPSGRKVYRTF